MSETILFLVGLYELYQRQHGYDSYFVDL